MVDICEYLEVQGKNNPSGVVIEECGDYNPALSDFVLVLGPHKIEPLKAWIKRNVKNAQDHCINMLDADPRTTFSYLMRTRNLSECTSEFVHDAGDSIQNFIDKYAGVANVTMAAAPEVAPEVAPETAEAEQVPESEEEPQEVAKSAEEETTADSNPVTEETTADQSFSQPELPAEPPEQIVKKEVVIEEHVTHRRVKTIQEYDPNLIEEISDGQISESLVKLRELNARIALGGLDPDLVLNDDDLEEVYKRIYTYPPDVFKSFILAYLKSVASETERYRVSAVMDDFLSFIED